MPVSRISWAYRSWFPIFLLLFLLYSRAGSTGIQKETNLGRIILLHTGTYSGSSTDYISFLLSDIASHWNDNVLLIKRHCTEIVAGVKNEKKIKWQRHVKHLFYHILQLSSVHSALKWMKPPLRPAHLKHKAPMSKALEQEPPKCNSSVGRIKKVVLAQEELWSVSATAWTRGKILLKRSTDAQSTWNIIETHTVALRMKTDYIETAVFMAAIWGLSVH